MNTLVIIILVGVVVLYIGSKALVIAYEIFMAMTDGANAIIKKSPSYVLKVLGRRNKGAKVEIDNDNLRAANANCILRKNEINQLNAYAPKLQLFDQRFDAQAYDRKIKRISRRELVNTDKTNFSDLDLILNPNNESIKNKIQSLARGSEFNIAPPTFLSTVPPPQKITAYPKIKIKEPSIRLPLWDGNLSKLNPYVYKEFEHEMNLVENAKENLKKLIEIEPLYEQEINKAYEIAEARYEKALIDEKNAYENHYEEWLEIKKRWEAESHQDQVELENLLLAFKSNDVEKQACLILDSIDLPKWMPCNYELKYDKETKILIVEHEFVDIGSIEWVKTVMLKSGATNKPLNQKELKHATDLLYPSVTLRLAYELATQLEGDVEAIAVNGWADYIVRSSGNTKRAYCSSLLATVDDIKNLSLAKL